MDGLMSAPDRADLLCCSTSNATRFAAGMRPAKIPNELPTEFRLVIHRDWAGTLGLTISPSILIRAAEIIE